MSDFSNYREQLDGWTAALQSESFEDVFESLEQVLDALEDGNLPLADTIAFYELGMGLNARCQEILDQATLKISEIDTAMAENQRDNSKSDPFRIGMFSPEAPF